MKINDPNLVGSGVTSTGVSKSAQTGRTAPAAGKPDAGQTANADGDGVQLSTLAQSLGGLEAESPERQAKVDALAKAYADGAYSVDPDKTAAGIIDDALGGQ
jgi:flagellar biosynthesis anti-sigma factor FlgM